MVDIDYIMNLLDWNNSEIKQAEGIRLAQNVKQIDVFLQPCDEKCNKNVWDNCAKILSERTDEELTPYLTRLLEWLQDLNWPGTFIIIDRLKRFGGAMLLIPYREIINNSLIDIEKNREWLNHLSVLIENHDLSKRIDKELLAFLIKIYEDFWGKEYDYGAVTLE